VILGGFQVTSTAVEFIAEAEKFSGELGAKNIKEIERVLMTFTKFIAMEHTFTDSI